MQTIIKSYRNKSIFIKLHFNGEVKNVSSQNNVENILDTVFFNISNFSNIVDFIIYLRAIFSDYQEDFFAVSILNAETTWYIDFFKGKLRTYKKCISNEEITFYYDVNEKLSVIFSNISLTGDEPKSYQNLKRLINDELINVTSLLNCSKNHKIILNDYTRLRKKF